MIADNKKLEVQGKVIMKVKIFNGTTRIFRGVMNVPRLR